ncbi:MAG TPA: adenylate/guanylate cyclase domain-containing protein, partial [Bacilli bacterium]|nr:adenylate/guanylate cyclase domain-containing protein [Bacilli bacterium]
ARGPFGVLSFCQHWQHPLVTSVDLAKSTHHKAMETGDMMTATSSIAMMVSAQMYSGTPLDEVEREIATYYDFMRRMNYADFQTDLYTNRMVIRNLRGEVAEAGSFHSEELDEVSYVTLDVHNETRYGISRYHARKAFVLYLLGQPQAALVHSRSASQDLEAHFAQMQMPQMVFHHGLILAANDRLVSAKERVGMRRQLRKQLKLLQKWSLLCPVNYLHEFLLLQAEWKRINGRYLKAYDLYEQAIQTAQANGFTHHVALANELAAKCYLAQGKERIAKLFLQDARYNYLKWGATAVVKRLEDEHPGLLTAARLDTVARTEPGDGVTTHPTMLATTDSRGQSLDLMTVMKASNAISGEIVLDKLLENLINIVVENAGAEKGYLLIERDGDLRIEAEKSVANGRVVVLQSLPFQQGALAATVVQYAARMKDPIVLHEAHKSGMFQKDSYIRDHEVKSILCLPLLTRGRLIGVLYLENNLATYAFTSDRLEVVKMLSSQIAISIANAELYDRQVALNRAYGRFVPHQFLRFLEKKSIVDVKLGDHVQAEMSVVFTDIRNFTALSERMTPEENFEFLNEYLKTMEPCVNENNGFIDKYIGDSIMALFDRGADDAVRASIAMFRQLNDYNAARTAQGLEPLQIGIGINSGKLMLGTLGSPHRMDSTVISDAVNLASRVEGLTKVYGAKLLITEHTHRRLTERDAYGIRLLDRVQVRGKTEEIHLYEVLAAEEDGVREGKLRTRERFEQAVNEYHAGRHLEAERLFLSCWQENRQDRTAQLYLERCAHRLAQLEVAAADAVEVEEVTEA